MALSLSKIVALPALFLAFGGEPNKAKAQYFPLDETEIKKTAVNLLEGAVDFKSSLLQQDTHPAGASSNKTNDFFILSTDIFLPITLTLGTFAGILLLLSLLTKSSKDNNKISNLNDLIKQFETDNNHNRISGITKDIHVSEDVSPEEKARLKSVIKFLTSASELNNLINDPSINLYFCKSDNIIELLKEREPSVFSQYQDANYSSWKPREDLKLNSFTLVEQIHDFNETVNYVIIIEEYKDYEIIMLSLLRELFRIHTYQNNENKIPVLYSLQIDTLQNELKSLEEMLDAICKSSPELEKRIIEIIKEESKQLDLWRSASCQYNIDALDRVNLWVKDI